MRIGNVRATEFADFYAESRDACLRAVLASVTDPLLAEDMVAEAFARAWASWSKVRHHPEPRAWVVRTALNVRISWWRRHRREVPLDETTPASVAPDRVPDAVDPVLLAHLRALPQRQREVIALRVFLDLDTRATARTLGIAEGTVTAHLARAVATLRTQLFPDAHPGGTTRDKQEAMR